MHPPSTLAQITKNRSVSIGWPGPTELRHHPGLPVILTSGAMLTLETAALPSILIPVEPKPYDFQAILTRINGALGL